MNRVSIGCFDAILDTINQFEDNIDYHISMEEESEETNYGVVLFKKNIEVKKFVVLVFVSPNSTIGDIIQTIIRGTATVRVLRGLPDDSLELVISSIEDAPPLAQFEDTQQKVLSHEFFGYPDYIEQLEIYSNEIRQIYDNTFDYLEYNHYLN